MRIGFFRLISFSLIILLVLTMAACNMRTGNTEAGNAEVSNTEVNLTGTYNPDSNEATVNIDNNLTAANNPEASRESIKTVIAGDIVSMLLTGGGDVWKWGFKPGPGAEIYNVTYPERLEKISDIIGISSGTDNYAYLKKDGTVWGYWQHCFNQPGEDEEENSEEGDYETPVMAEGLTDVIAVSSGNYHLLALKKDGTVWAWGNNEGGELGDGTNESRYTPEKVIGLENVTACSANGFSSLALSSDGIVWAWGQNSDGELGDGTNEDRNTPVRVKGLSNIKAISAGLGYSLALDSHGHVWTWGNNFVNTKTNIPVKVENLEGIVAISSGGFSLALKSDGSVWSWGGNSRGQLGNGTNTDSKIPVKVKDLDNIVQISAGVMHALAVRSDGTVYGWGDNYSGAIGDGTVEDRNIPVKVRFDVNNPHSGSSGNDSQYVDTEDNDADQWKFGPEDIYIDHKPVLDVTYEKLVEEFGNQKKVKTLTVRLPAASDDDYMNVCVYDGFECEFSPNDEVHDIEPADTVFRFDVTGAGVELDCGLRIGMSIEEINNKFGERVVYSLKSNEESFELIDINAVLEGYKPDGYYSAYTGAMFIDHDFEKFDEPFGRILVLLLKDGKLDRIVFGYPTAG